MGKSSSLGGAGKGARAIITFVPGGLTGTLVKITSLTFRASLPQTET